MLKGEGKKERRNTEDEKESGGAHRGGMGGFGKADRLPLAVRRTRRGREAKEADR